MQQTDAFLKVLLKLLSTQYVQAKFISFKQPNQLLLTSFLTAQLNLQDHCAEGICASLSYKQMQRPGSSSTNSEFFPRSISTLSGKAFSYGTLQMYNLHLWKSQSLDLEKEPVPSLNILSKLYQVINLYGFKLKASKMQSETPNPTSSTDWHLTIASPQKLTHKRQIHFMELNSNLRPECVSPGRISRLSWNSSILLGFISVVYQQGASFCNSCFTLRKFTAFCIFQEKMQILFCSSKFFMKKPVNHCKNTAVNFVQFTAQVSLHF